MPTLAQLYRCVIIEINKERYWVEMTSMLDSTIELGCFTSSEFSDPTLATLGAVFYWLIIENPAETAIIFSTH